MGGGLESRCVGRVYGADGAVRVAFCYGIPFFLKSRSAAVLFFGLHSRMALNEFCNLYWINHFFDAVNVAYNSYGKETYLP